MHKNPLVIFLAEVFGTFGLIVAATGSIVYNARISDEPDMAFIAMIHFVGLFFMVYLFGRFSMAHFNPAVTIGYLVTGHITKLQVLLYVTAEAIGAILGSLFVLMILGDYANLGANAPNHSLSIPYFYGIEILASAFLMGGILFAISIKKFPTGIVSMIIAGTVALDVFFFGQISGASMNPIRSLIPAIFAGVLSDLWLYLSAPFIGTVISAFIYKLIKSRHVTRA